MAIKKQPATRWYDGSTPIEELPPTEQLAHALVSQYGDLAPSVERVMEAELDDDQRGRARHSAIPSAARATRTVTRVSPLPTP